MIIGLAPSDDAAVMQLTPELALVSTTDFFPPLVDDPADFGAIAAANACSDVFAMGGDVRLALNIAAFPEELPTDAIEAILAAAADTVAAAGGVVAGGHTIRSEEPIFGLAVQGIVHPRSIWTKAGARPGDEIVLSKPLGTGIVLAAGSTQQRAAAVGWMRMLNLGAAAQLRDVTAGRGPSACTDVTGYGLIGHTYEIAQRSGVTIELDTQALPLLDGAEDAARGGARTGGDARNRSAYSQHIVGAEREDIAREALAFDPQTSGGLLASVTPDIATRLLAEGWWRVGLVRAGTPSVVLN